jgi:hypothetical protein
LGNGDCGRLQKQNQKQNQKHAICGGKTISAPSNLPNFYSQSLSMKSGAPQLRGVLGLGPPS